MRCFCLSLGDRATGTVPEEKFYPWEVSQKQGTEFFLRPYALPVSPRLDEAASTEGFLGIPGRKRKQLEEEQEK